MRRRKPRPHALIAWNCWVGNKGIRVYATLTHWIKTYQPDTIVLSEARTHRAALLQVARDTGYVLHQEEPAKYHRWLVDDRGDTAILVRDPASIIRRKVATTARRWTVFSKRRTHTPRRSEVVVLRVDGQRWRVRADHPATGGFNGGNRTAFSDHMRRTLAWLLASGPRTASVAVGDMNEDRATLAAWFGKRFRVFGHGIDLAVTRNVVDVECRQLGKGGSDTHRGQLYLMSAH